MFRLLCLTVALIYIQGANHHNLTTDEIAQMLWDDMNPMSHSNISLHDLHTEFITKFDADGDQVVNQHDFVQQWHKLYHDYHDVCEEFFRRLDIDSSGHLDNHDLEMHFMATDQDQDGVLSFEEFREFIRHVHPDSTYHGHGHHDPVLG